MYNKRGTRCNRKVKLWRFYFCIKSKISERYSRDKRGFILTLFCAGIMLFYMIFLIRLYFNGV